MRSTHPLYYSASAVAMASRYVAEEEGTVDVNSAPNEEKFAENEADLELHRVVFHGDLEGTLDSLQRGADVSVHDRYGKSESCWSE